MVWSWTLSSLLELQFLHLWNEDENSQVDASDRSDVFQYPVRFRCWHSFERLRLRVIDTLQTLSTCGPSDQNMMTASQVEWGETIKKLVCAVLTRSRKCRTTSSQRGIKQRNNEDIKRSCGHGMLVSIPPVADRHSTTGAHCDGDWSCEAQAGVGGFLSTTNIIAIYIVHRDIGAVHDLYR